MKIALVHDYLKEYGGAERVLETLHEIFPDAPVFTLVYIPSFLGPHKERFENWDIKTSFVQYLPFKEKLISPLRLLAPVLFKTFDFSDFDVVIVSATGAYNPNMINKKSGVQICFCHTPPRYLYGYKTAREWKNNLVLKVLGETANHFLRLIDFKSAQNVDYFIANSEEVRSRIKKFYRRDADVVYPPVEVPKILTDSKPINTDNQRKSVLNPRKSYYLTGGRLARAKGIDVIIKAFVKSGKPLKIFGKGFAGFEKDLKQMTNGKAKNIEFLGEVTDKEKFELMKNSKAFIFASFDEDFGITPVEAMSVGTPVIAYNCGGVKETVINNKTGVFYDLNDSNHLAEAIKKFESIKINPKDCIKQAQKFSKERFIREIKKLTESIKR